MSDAQSPTEGRDGPGRIRRMVCDAQEQVREARVRGLGATARIPERIGRYRILGVEGRGGMGVVYRAEQSQPRRIVALKVISPHLLSANSLRRFFYEAESLGRLQHPGIARIYEADAAQTTLGSQPFFAMELVDGGISLTKYAKQHGLNLQARLELMAKVCDAVHHAHQKGVIHRDLKPANILVDETGQPKILDFGIARIMEDGEHEGATRTMTGQLVGTLPYMSPEQCAADPDEVDIRTDIYALGVIAYELLADRHPHDVEKTPMLEAARIIREQDPTPLGAIKRIYRGDIETIVAKALNRDKADRYQSALEFATDMGRFLRNEPISARTSSVSYHVIKFVKRNRVLAGAFVTCILALIGTAAAVSWALSAQRAEMRAEERTHAQMVLSDALGALAGSLYQSDPDQALNILSETKARADEQFRDAPRGRTLILAALGTIHWAHFQAYDQATEDLSECLAIRRTEFDVHDEQTLRVANILGDVLRDAGKLERAEALAREWREICLNHFGAEHEQTTRFATNLADAFKGSRKLAAAEELYRKTLAIQSKVLPAEHPDLPETINSLAETLVLQSRFEDAEVLAIKAYELQERYQGANNAATLRAERTIGLALLGQGKLKEAEDHLESAHAGFKNVHGHGHVETITALCSLARLRQAQGRFEEASQWFDEVVERASKVLPEDHWRLRAFRRYRQEYLAGHGR